MRRASCVAVLVGWALFAIRTAGIGQEIKPPRTGPNVVLILMDDMGYGDLDAYGGIDYVTPHIDRLSAQGMRFTDFYSAQPICTASRAGLMTGCYPNRIGLYGALGPYSRIGISDSEVTIAQMLKSKGYATGIIGKWHLGVGERFSPL
ncbi:MAG TPA: sulfatase-like hydrolase/transferase, partial [Puia sp.]|nr:sulfatase-like hydrolase/transferase [Puia sp.]